MNNTSQQKNTLVDLIREEMKRRELDEPDLVRATGLSQPVIWRLLNGGVNIKISNIYKVLICLNLLNVSPTSTLPHLVVLPETIQKFPVIKKIITEASEAAKTNDVKLLKAILEYALDKLREADIPAEGSVRRDEAG